MCVFRSVDCSSLKFAIVTCSAVIHSVSEKYCFFHVCKDCQLVTDVAFS